MAKCISRIAIILLTLCCCMTACKGGDFVALVINSITPTGVVGKVGDVVIFHADVSGTGTLVYDWTLSGGGSITGGATTDSPTVTCTTAGNFMLSLTVSDGSTTDSANNPITIDPAIPVITQVSPDGDVGLPAGTVIFSNDATSQPTSWLWTFPIGDTSFLFTTATAELQLPDVGAYAGTLVATNANGSSDPFPFEYTVTQPVAPTWAMMEMGPALTPNSSEFRGALSCTVLDGRFALLYNAPDGLRFVRALVPYPAGPGDWQTHHMGTDLLTFPNSLVVYNGHLTAQLARIVEDFWPGLHRLTDGSCAIAMVAEPASPSDWAIHALPEEVGGSMAAMDGALCIAGGVFARTTATVPSSAADWDFHTLPEIQAFNEFGGAEQLLRIGDEWAVLRTSFSQDFFTGYAISVSNTLAPMEAGDWFSQKVSSGLGASSSSLADFGGRLGLFHTNISFEEHGDQHLIAVSGPLPLTPGTSWTEYELEALGSSFSAGGGGASGILQGRPYVFLKNYDADGGFFRLARSITVDPLRTPSSLSWEFTTLDAGAGVGKLAVSAVIDDRIIVAYVNGEPSTLHVAVTQGPY